METLEILFAVTGNLIKIIYLKKFLTSSESLLDSSISMYCHFIFLRFNLVLVLVVMSHINF